MSSSEPRPGAEKKQKVEEKHGEKRPGDQNEQSTRRVTFEEPKGEKRKELETEFEDNFRSLQTKATNLGPGKSEILDIRGWKVSAETTPKTLDKVQGEKPMVIIGESAASSFS